MKKTILAGIALLICLSLQAQRTGVREEVLDSWMLSSGLDCVLDWGPKASTPAPKGYEPVYISHYGRHGSRYAYTEKAYTVLLEMLSEGQKAGNLTPYAEKLLQELQPFWDNVRYRVGDLTPLGWEQHQQIARTMVSSFPTVFGKGSEVDACSSPSVRSIISMSSCCAALSRLAPQAKIYEHQGLMDVQATRPNTGKNPFRYQGPAMPLPYAERSDKFFERRFPAYRQVLTRLFKDPDAGLGRFTPYDAFFNLYMFVGGQNSLPADERIDVSDFFTPEEYAILWEIDNYERFREYWAYKTPCSSIVDDMVDKADAALLSGKRGASLRYGHDHVVMALLMVMDIDGFDTVPEKNDDLVYWFQTFRSPMAANIQIVLLAPRKGNAPVLAKVLLNGEEARLGSLEAFSGPYYKWDDVRSYLRARVAKFAFKPKEGEWTATEIAPGLIYRSFSGLEPVSGSAQQIFVADWDMSAPGYSFKYAVTPQQTTTSSVFAEKGAIVAMNACYEPSSIVLKVDGEYYSNIPYNTVMTTGVPNWKSEAAIYTDGGNDVRIVYEGQGKTNNELRAFFGASKEPNIYTSAPMLIDNHKPLGASFAGFYSEDAMMKFDYEAAPRHQGVRHPRTAVAITDDNHLLMVVVDGRRPGISEGMSARELTFFLQENFHPRQAINMDGGGSSTLCVRGQGDPQTNVVNYPTGNKLYDHAGERGLVSFFYLVKE